MSKDDADGAQGGYRNSRAANILGEIIWAFAAQRSVIWGSGGMEERRVNFHVCTDVCL
jgi:hypothetical protein